MVSTHFHFNGFFPNMLYFFSCLFCRLCLLTPTFIIEPKIIANGKTPYWLQSVSTGLNVNMVFLRATRYCFLLTNHSIHTIKGTEQNLIKILSTGFLKTLILLGFQTFSIYSNSTITNQFCLEIICCRVRFSFNYLIYPYYHSYMS